LFSFFTIPFQNIYSQNNLYTPLEFQKAYEKKTRAITGKPGQNYWQNFATYTIQAEVFPALSILKGQEQIKYSNNSPDTLNSITMQLYQDMYKRGNPRDRYIHPTDVTDGIILHDLKINNERFDLETDKRVLRDKALLIINLDNPVLPSTDIILSIQWEFHIPEKTSIRFGKYDSTSFFIAYWFPRIAVYDDYFGWDRYGYDGYHELNNDYANFEIKIKTPKNFLVWSTGDLMNPEEVLSDDLINKIEQTRFRDELTHIIGNPDTYNYNKTSESITWYFKANFVTDFAFGLSNHHLWDAIPVTVNDGRQVLIHVVYPPNAKEYLKKMPEFLKQCIKHYSENTPGVPYPYNSYTLFYGLNTGWHTAIEFPSFVNQVYLTNDTFNYAITAHELAHSYFPYYVNINQTQFSWMDEGIANYMAYDIFRYLLKLNEFHPLYSGNPLDKNSGFFLDIPVFTSSLLYHVSATGSHTAYNRPSFAYIILEDFLGKELFIRCFREFTLRWQGKRPIPYDLFYTFNDVSGENLNWFWKPWFFEFAYPDLSIDVISNNNEVTIKNVGKLPLPIYLQITYENDSVEEVYKTVKVWEKGDPEVKIKLKERNSIKMLKLNDQYFIPDVDRNNNTCIINN